MLNQVFNCSKCGHKAQAIGRPIDEWACPKCGTTNRVEQPLRFVPSTSIGPEIIRYLPAPCNRLCCKVTRFLGKVFPW